MAGIGRSRGARFAPQGRAKRRSRRWRTQHRARRVCPRSSARGAPSRLFRREIPSTKVAGRKGGVTRIRPASKIRRSPYCEGPRLLSAQRVPRRRRRSSKKARRLASLRGTVLAKHRQARHQLVYPFPHAADSAIEFLDDLDRPSKSHLELDDDGIELCRSFRIAELADWSVFCWTLCWSRHHQASSDESVGDMRSMIDSALPSDNLVVMRVPTATSSIERTSRPCSSLVSDQPRSS